MGHILRLLGFRHMRGLRSRYFNSSTSNGHPSTDLPLDRIDLKSLQLFGFHGVGAREKKYGQRFIIDASLFLSLKRSGQTDKLHHTVNYASVLRYLCSVLDSAKAAVRDLEKIMNGPSVDLIEHLADLMCFHILEGYPLIHKVQICIRKPEAPLPIPKDLIDSVGVTLSRKREDFKFVKRPFDEFDD